MYSAAHTATRRTLLLFAFLLSEICGQGLSAQQPQFQYDSTGRLLRSIHEVYDDHDRLAVAIIYDYNDTSGAVETRTLKGYDKQGRLIRTEIYSDDERLLFTDDIYYCPDGTIRKRKQRNYEEQQD